LLPHGHSRASADRLGTRAEDRAPASPTRALDSSVPPLAVPPHESQQRDPMVGAVPLGHQSSHQRAVRLTTRSGQSRQRPPSCSTAPLLWDRSPGRRQRPRPRRQPTPEASAASASRSPLATTRNVAKAIARIERGRMANAIVRPDARRSAHGRACRLTGWAEVLVGGGRAGLPPVAGAG
jgi:hypothetical protein